MQNLQAKSIHKDKLTMIKSSILYVFSSFIDDLSKLGKVKLHKILWFSDSESLAKSYKTITGQYEYRVKKYGPVLPLIHNALDDLDPEENAPDSTIAIKPKLINSILDAADTTTYIKKLSSEDKEILDYWINFVRDKNAHQVVDYAHKYSWWEYTVIVQPIPVHLGALEVNLIKTE